jgi:hypothetical protein
LDLASIGSAFGHFWNQHPLFRGVSGALIVGAVGSSAYMGALFLGFLGDQTLSQFKSRFQRADRVTGLPVLSQLRLGMFVAFGALIAVVFQLAQGGTFAPVQALVLGATWPTVISQILTQVSKTDADKILDLAKRIGGA